MALEMVQSQSNRVDDWLDKTAALYEKLLVLKYLEDRDAHLDSLKERVQEELERIVTKPVSLENASIEKEEKAAPAPDLSANSEVRVVPHPEGPPVPVDTEEDITEIPEPQIEEVPKPVAVEVEAPSKPTSKPKKATQKQSIAEKAASSNKKSLNDKLSKQTLKFGLNDRIAFVKHLFNGSQEDFHRVISQLNSFDSQEEASQFIDHIVKPEYSWSGKEEFEERFMDIVNSRYQ